MISTSNKTPARETQVASAMGTLGAKISASNQILDELENRISSCLIARRITESTAGEKCKDEEQCACANQLGAMARDVQAFNDRLANIIARCEL